MTMEIGCAASSICIQQSQHVLVQLYNNVEISFILRRRWNPQHLDNVLEQGNTSTHTSLCSKRFVVDFVVIIVSTHSKGFFIYYFIINWNLTITRTYRRCSWLQAFPCPTTCLYSLQCCKRFLTTFYTNSVVHVCRAFPFILCFFTGQPIQLADFDQKLLQMSVLQISTNFIVIFTHTYVCVSNSIVIYNFWPMLYPLCLLLNLCINREIYFNTHELL